MEKYVQDSLTNGIIRPSSSPAGAGFFFVAKKDSPLRPCIEYRGLNDITVKDRYPLPLMSSAFELLRGSTIFSKLDLLTTWFGFVRGMNGRLRSIPQRDTMSNLVMPFGLTNAPAVFQALVNYILRDKNKYI